MSNLKSILSHSEFGIHILFDNQLISEVFKEPFTEDEFFQAENLKKIQDDLLKILQYKTLYDKKGFISSLNRDDQHRIVRAYFYIIENNLKATQKLPH